MAIVPIRNLGGGGEAKPKYITTDLVFMSGRTSYVSGGYYVKNGICHIDVTFKATSSTSQGDGYSMIQRFPHNSGSVVTYDKFKAINDSNQNNTASIVFNGSQSVTSGNEYKFVAQYSTDHADT